MSIAVPEHWPTLMQWRYVIAETLARELGLDGGRKVNSTPSPWAPPDPPFIVVASGNPYIQPFDSETSTFCTHRASFDVGLIGGPPGNLNAELLVESWVEMFPAALKRCKDDPLFPVHGLVQEGDVGGVRVIEFDELRLVGAVAAVSAEIQYETKET